MSGDTLDEVLTNAARFVLPSDLESAWLALLDAMGAGVCVLASDVPENCELVEGRGFTFRGGDVEDLRRMLSLLLSNLALRQAAAGLARQHVQQNSLGKTVVGAVDAVYRQLLPSKNPLQIPKTKKSSLNAALQKSQRTSLMVPTSQ